MNCDNCNDPITPLFPDMPTQSDGGLDFRVMGHYGGFLDNWFGNEEESYISLCHDCVVQMFDSVPAAFAKFANGKNHPECGDNPCVYGGWGDRNER